LSTSVIPGGKKWGKQRDKKEIGRNAE